MLLLLYKKFSVSIGVNKEKAKSISTTHNIKEQLVNIKRVASL